MAEAAVKLINLLKPGLKETVREVSADKNPVDGLSFRNILSSKDISKQKLSSEEGSEATEGLSQVDIEKILKMPKDKIEDKLKYLEGNQLHLLNNYLTNFFLKEKNSMPGQYSENLKTLINKLKDIVRSLLNNQMSNYNNRHSAIELSELNTYNSDQSITDNLIFKKELEQDLSNSIDQKKFIKSTGSERDLSENEGINLKKDNQKESMNSTKNSKVKTTTSRDNLSFMQRLESGETELLDSEKVLVSKENKDEIINDEKSDTVEDKIARKSIEPLNTEKHTDAKETAAVKLKEIINGVDRSTDKNELNHLLKTDEKSISNHGTDTVTIRESLSKGNQSNQTMDISNENSSDNSHLKEVKVISKDINVMEKNPAIEYTKEIKDLSDRNSQDIRSVNQEKVTINILDKNISEEKGNKNIVENLKFPHNEESSIVRSKNEIRDYKEIFSTRYNLDKSSLSKSKDNPALVEQIISKDNQNAFSKDSFKLDFNQVVNNIPRENTTGIFELRTVLDKLSLLDEPSLIKEKKIKKDLISRTTIESDFQTISKDKPNLINSKKANTVIRSDLFTALDKIDQAIKVQKNNTRSQLSIQLEPESLGKIKVDLRVENGEVIARLVVESQNVKEYLDQNVSVLKNSLLKQGFNLENFEVQTNQQFDADFQGQTGGRQFNQEEGQQRENSNDDFFENHLLELSPEEIAEGEKRTTHEIPLNYGRRKISQYNYNRQMSILA